MTEVEVHVPFGDGGTKLTLRAFGVYLESTEVLWPRLTLPETFVLYLPGEVCEVFST